jgi:cytosine/adenosine deaminase-related metal-dependent hydrolase
MRRAGVPVGLGVDGSASNDQANMVGELRQAMLLQRVSRGAGAMTPRQALEMATIGGARVLNRSDVGALVPGMAADLAAFDLTRLEFAGAQHDPVAALALCGPISALHTLVGGRFVVRDGRLTTLDLNALVRRHNQLSRELVDG